MAVCGSSERSLEILSSSTLCDRRWRRSDGNGDGDGTTLFVVPSENYTANTTVTTILGPTTTPILDLATRIVRRF